MAPPSRIRAPGDQPRVSVVTPSLNQAPFLEATIGSVLSQDYPHIEYLVIDGGSTDGSVEIIRRHADSLAYWVSEADRGQSHAINKGWARATGDVLAWLNADDRYNPGAVSAAVEALRDFPDADLVYADCDETDARTGRMARRHVEPRTLQQILSGEISIPQPTVFIRRRLLDRIGGLEETLHYTMDYHLLLRAFSFGQARYLPGRSLATITLHPRAKSFAAAALFPRELVKTLDLYYALPDLPQEALSVKRRAYARYFYACADMDLTVRHAYGRGAYWLARAYLSDPLLLARVPRAIWGTLTRRRAAAWRARTLTNQC